MLVCPNGGCRLLRMTGSHVLRLNDSGEGGGVQSETCWPCDARMRHVGVTSTAYALRTLSVPPQLYMCCMGIVRLPMQMPSANCT